KIISDNLASNQLEFSNLIIDDVVIFDDYQNYIKNNFEAIQEIVVIVKSEDTSTLIKETLKSTFEYISNANSYIGSLAEEFYQFPKQETWKQLINLFEGIQWLIETLIKIDSLNNLQDILLNYTIWNEYVQIITKLSAQISELEKAMQAKDNVLIGDLLMYEILPVFENAEEKLRFLIPSEKEIHVS
ncbi:MAG: hypothetical protein RBQ97_08870, partial [Acholeplasma sp.]|nr:hypothetical protein [Acholeplasma sp.]